MGWMIANRGTTVSLEVLELDGLPVPPNSLSHSDSLVSHRTSASTARCEKRAMAAGLELAVWALSADAARPVPTGYGRAWATPQASADNNRTEASGGRDMRNTLKNGAVSSSRTLYP
jgi:hypothetical protein